VKLFNVFYPVQLIIKAWRYRKLLKNRRIIQQSLIDLNALTVTVHGRTMLTQVIHDPDNGLPDEIRYMYQTLLKQAPVKVWASRN
jgi:hypothetical protein